MTILKEANKVEEFLDLKNLDKVRKVGSLSGWQRRVYNLITVRFADNILGRMMEYVNKLLPEDADPEDVKSTLKLALMDYVESAF
jgi:hypothetical protein